MDVKSAFLYDDLDEIILMSQHVGHEEEKSKEDYVCRLNMLLYDPKQSPMQWNKRFDKFMASIGFIRSNFNHCVYFRFSPKNPLVILLLYVDDIHTQSNLI